MSRTGAAVVAAAALLALTACSSGSTSTTPSGASSTASPVGPSAASTSPSSTAGSPSTSPSAGSQSPVPATSGTPGALVSRSSGKPADQRVDSKPTTIGKTAVYPDGMTVRITRIAQSTVTASGPGEVTGQPMTKFTITITNGTKSTLVLDQVVVSAFYGSPSLRAQPLYGPGIGDFGTKVAPGKAASTVYAFTIPVKQLASVTLTVDVDGAHGLATFTGPAKPF